MKIIKYFLAVAVSCFTLQSNAQTIQAFDQIVFFGDSLSDAGYLYRKDLGLLPKSPPYFKGRFSNGPVWSERLGADVLKEGITTQNYAVGGETINFYNPPSSLMPYDLSLSFYEFILNNLLSEKSHTLFVVWIGGNDYIGRKIADADKFTTDTVNTVKMIVESMAQHGGKYFLIVNLPDLGKTPYAQSSNKADELSQLTKLHNSKLQSAVAAIQQDVPTAKVALFDMYGLFEDLQTHPEVYNNKYAMHISNLTEACWTGGNTLASIPNADIEANLTHEFSKAGSVKIDTAAMASAIQTNPVLNTAYTIGQRYAAGVVPCADPDSYVFWDSIHPTSVVHTLISIAVGDFIHSNYD